MYLYSFELYTEELIQGMKTKVKHIGFVMAENLELALIRIACVFDVKPSTIELDKIVNGFIELE